MLKENRVAFLLLFSSTLMIVCLILFRAASPSSRPIASRGTAVEQEKIASDILRDWAGKKYISITNTVEFDASIKRLADGTRSSDFVTPAMADGLARSLRDFIHAYHKGSLEAYLKFRLPVGIDYVEHPEARNRIKSYFVKSPVFSPVSDEFDVFWAANYKNRTFVPPEDEFESFKIYLKDFSGHNYYSNYFSAVCFDEAIVRVDRDKGKLPEAFKKYPFFPEMDLGGFSASAPFPNIGFLRVGHYSTFEYKINIPAILASGKDIFTANCFMFIRVNYPENYKPIMVRFYWVEELNKWLVDDIVDGNIRGGSNYVLLL